MTDLKAALAALRRPPLLIRAARFGLADYDRDAVLKRIFGYGAPQPGRACMSRLLDLEGTLDRERRQRSATYSVERHVELLVAVMAESRAVTAPVDQPKASRIVDLRCVT